MKALLLKLSAIDSETEAALRVIAYFDALAIRSATAEMVVRGAAAIAEATAGLQFADGSVVRFDVRGAPVPGRPAGSPALEEVAGGVRVWIEREGPQRPFDRLVLERFALVAKGAAPERSPRKRTALADPAVVELVLSAREPMAERRIALRRLGFSPDHPVIMIAVASDESVPFDHGRIEQLVHAAAARSTATGARWGSLGAIVVQPSPGADAAVELAALRSVIARSGEERSTSFRCGMSAPVDALDAAEGWTSARDALRFARRRSGGASIVSAAELGAVAALASVSADVWARNWRVSALRELSGSESGLIDLEVLEAYLSHGSLRMAGQALHMHHSSVASRLARLEERLNLNFTVQVDLFQARLCMYAAALLDTE